MRLEQPDWKKVMKCVTMSQNDATQSDMIQVPSGTYDSEIVVSASDTTWNRHTEKAKEVSQSTLAFLVLAM